MKPKVDFISFAGVLLQIVRTESLEHIHIMYTCWRVFPYVVLSEISFKSHFLSVTQWSAQKCRANFKFRFLPTEVLKYKKTGKQTPFTHCGHIRALGHSASSHAHFGRQPLLTPLYFSNSVLPFTETTAPFKWEPLCLHRRLMWDYWKGHNGLLISAWRRSGAFPEFQSLLPVVATRWINCFTSM